MYVSLSINKRYMCGDRDLKRLSEALKVMLKAVIIH